MNNLNTRNILVFKQNLCQELYEDNNISDVGLKFINTQTNERNIENCFDPIVKYIEVSYRAKAIVTLFLTTAEGTKECNFRICRIKFRGNSQCYPDR